MAHFKIYQENCADVTVVSNIFIDEYMKEEVLPHVPDAMYFFEEDTSAKKPIIKTGAEIPFTRYFYEYKEPKNSEKLEREFLELEASLNKRIEDLFKEV